MYGGSMTLKLAATVVDACTDDVKGGDGSLLVTERARSLTNGTDHFVVTVAGCPTGVGTDFR